MTRRTDVSLGLALLLGACGSPEAEDTQDTQETGGVVDACADPQGEGYGVGDVSMDWSLQDINGQTVSLYDYCGRVIYIENTAAW
jgi:hypothetical protein